MIYDLLGVAGDRLPVCQSQGTWQRGRGRVIAAYIKAGVSTPEQVSTAFIAAVPAPGSGSIPRAPVLISAIDFSP